MKLYVASSWRNPYQQDVVTLLRDIGHEVYDFRNPAPGDNGFSWRSIEEGWENWTPAQWRKALEHPIAAQGFANDFGAMKWADACVLVLPSGRSSHLEAGWMSGAGKPVVMYVPEEHPQRIEPDLMVKLFGPTGSFVVSQSELVLQLERIASGMRLVEQGGRPW